MRLKSGACDTIATLFWVVSAAFIAFWAGALDEGGEKTDSRNYLTETALKSDIVATGNTYFSLERDSVEVYVRSGVLCVLPHGELALRTKDGEFPFTPRVPIPYNAKSFEVDIEGNVLIEMEGLESMVSVGQIQCNRFAAGRLLDLSLANVVTSDVAPLKYSFGIETQAIVLNGWRSENGSTDKSQRK